MKGNIYRLVCNETGLQYIGSTRGSLTKRLACHKSDYKKGTCSTNAWLIIQSGNYDIVLIEEIEYENKNQLHQRERFWIESLDCVNKNIPYRTEEERLSWRSKNKDLIKQLWESWYERNKERLMEKITCECGCEVNKRHLKEHLETELHSFNLLPEEEKLRIQKEKIENKKQYQAEWHQRNKERRNQKSKEYRERIKNDPEALAKSREYQRLWAQQNRLKKKMQST